MSGATAMSAGFSMMGAMNKADGQKATLGYEAAVADNNARVAEYQAQQAQAIGAQQEQTSRLETAQVFGAQRASLAANGIDLGQGSATDILTTTAHTGEVDALTIRDNAARTAWAHRVQAQNDTNNAAVTRASASAIDPTMAGVTSLLGSASSFASASYKKSASTKGG